VTPPLTDTARALLQCGKHEGAYLTLRAAEQIAPEEIRGHRAAHRIILDPMTSAPPNIQRQAAGFAQLIGMPAWTDLDHTTCADPGLLELLTECRRGHVPS
jgi:hypothetical protein